jgi:glyoxylase-like metal-dependent hydrolase (beta-lactamase superfamily II)
MALTIHSFVLGPLGNNTYLVVDDATQKAAVVDPASYCDELLVEIRRRNLQLDYIWLTHAHFDHIAGVHEVVQASEPAPQIALHPGDLELYHSGGGASLFGFSVQPGQPPDIHFEDEQTLLLGQSKLRVLFTPGHSLGHVTIYSEDAGTAFCGDLIFRGSIGRTDLPGGDYNQLMESIRQKILALPPETRLLSGHGPATTLAVELVSNPYLRNLQQHE